MPLRDAHGTIVGLCGISRDITERKHLEAQIRQFQKMEALGQLTGGVAHDFNNILAVILSNADFLGELLPPEDSRRELVTAICDASLRAATLTERLLAFSRKQSLHPERTNLAVVLDEISAVLRRTLDEMIEIRTECADRTLEIVIDRGQLENALINMAVNARDAMPGGGVLTMQAALVAVAGGGFRDNPTVPAGRYAVLSVADTGCGMAPKVASRVFEPFFTTKPQGQGTGLGLSMVYGFVKQSGGHIALTSREQEGTVFELLFPAAAEEQAAIAASGLPRWRDSAVPLLPHLSVLLVEDEPAVRAAVKKMLRSFGAEVSEAPDGPTAVAKLRLLGKCDLIVTDVVMPRGLSGPDVATEAARRFPQIKVLFISGHAGKRLTDSDLAPGRAFLRKPFKRVELHAAMKALFEPC